MWTIKFRFEGSNVFFGKAAKTFNLSLTGYPVSCYEKNKQLFLNLIGTMQGGEKDKQKFIRFIKKSDYALKLEANNDFLNILIKEDKKFKPFYSPYFIYLSPVKIDKSGAYFYHLGSWQREEITKLLDFIGKNYKYKLQNLKQEKINNISILGVQPNLTEKQRKVYELAVKEGYYKYPKRVKIKQLAKILGISYSTFQQHLKYAEKKISEFFVGKY
ncbi:MAG: helix-turn-helix domain-containing protein [Candidatus Aenigmarchaeota archaeon]|nr:helix-turn-helix domain-containing protein [Candidatus Aenigmarchaeota archaeon]